MTADPLAEYEALRDRLEAHAGPEAFDSKVNTLPPS